MYFLVKDRHANNDLDDKKSTKICNNFVSLPDVVQR